MISDSFDMESEAIITPSSFFGEKGKIFKRDISSCFETF